MNEGPDRKPQLYQGVDPTPWLYIFFVASQPVVG